MELHYFLQFPSNWSWILDPEALSYTNSELETSRNVRRRSGANVENEISRVEGELVSTER